MEILQFCAIVMLALLTLELVLFLPGRVIRNRMMNRSRWLLATGTMLLGLQFLLQYLYGFRSMGVTQAVMVNLLFFIPCSTLFSLAILNLQQQGRMERKTWMTGLGAVLLTWVILGLASAYDGRPLHTGSSLLRKAEYAASIIYILLQGYYSTILLRNDRRLRRALDNYYDYSTRSLLLWMRRVIVMITLLALGVPFLIFSSGILLQIYSATIFLTIFYLVTLFTFYCVSNDAGKVQEAERTVAETEAEAGAETPTLQDFDMEIISKAVDRWVKGRNYVRTGLTIPKVASEMRLPRYQLVMWLKTTEWELFNPWLASLRIEEAKRLLLDHADWSNDTIAHRCGFSSRSYFQRVFKKVTGLTPAEYIDQHR